MPPVYVGGGGGGGGAGGSDEPPPAPPVFTPRPSDVAHASTRRPTERLSKDVVGMTTDVYEWQSQWVKAAAAAMCADCRLDEEECSPWNLDGLWLNTLQLLRMLKKAPQRLADVRHDVQPSYANLSLFEAYDRVCSIYEGRTEAAAEKRLMLIPSPREVAVIGHGVHKVAEDFFAADNAPAYGEPKARYALVCADNFYHNHRGAPNAIERTYLYLGISLVEQLRQPGAGDSRVEIKLWLFAASYVNPEAERKAGIGRLQPLRGAGDSILLYNTWDDVLWRKPAPQNESAEYHFHDLGKVTEMMTVNRRLGYSDRETRELAYGWTTKVLKVANEFVTRAPQ